MQDHGLIARMTPYGDKPVFMFPTRRLDTAQGHAYSDSAITSTSSDRDGYKQDQQPQKDMHEGAAIGKSADNEDAEGNGVKSIPGGLPGAARIIVQLSALDGAVLEKAVSPYFQNVSQSAPSIRVALYSQSRRKLERSKPTILRRVANGLRFPEYLRIRATADKRYSRPLDSYGADVDC